MDPLPAAIVLMLGRANPAVVATVRADGSPASAPVWYRCSGLDVLMVMGRCSPRRRHLERDGRFSLTVLDGQVWTRQVTLRCRVTRLEDDADLVATDLLSLHYDGRPWPDRSLLHAVARAEIVGWSAFGL